MDFERQQHECTLDFLPTPHEDSPGKVKALLQVPFSSVRLCCLPTPALSLVVLLTIELCSNILDIRFTPKALPYL